MQHNASIFCVLNANRPLTDTESNALHYVQSIEEAAGVKITGLINNTHLCRNTEIQDVLKGALMANRVSELSGIPVVAHTVQRELVPQAEQFLESVFPIDIYMKKPWE